MFMIIMGSTFWTAPYHSLTTRELKRYVLFVPPAFLKNSKQSTTYIQKWSPLFRPPQYI